MVNLVKDIDEKNIWHTMQKELKEHRSYFVRKQFYPHNMEQWDKEHREIEQKYRKQLNKLRISKKEQQSKERKEKEEQLINDAADALLMLKKSKQVPKKKKVKNEVVVLRRSSRIASQQK
tara:strand:+ start:129 stop:488 length:360 start_codon:yes stop_codon:yes gene_type:complete